MDTGKVNLREMFKVKSLRFKVEEGFAFNFKLALPAGRHQTLNLPDSWQALNFALDYFYSDSLFGTGISDSIHTPDESDIARVDSFYSNLNIDNRQTENPELYNEVYRWYGTCYRYGGSNSNGVDCSHFVNALYEKIYGTQLQGNAASIYKQCLPLKSIHKAKEGDLIFFKIHGKRISHVGIYLQNGKFAHASTKLGVTISDMSEPYYKKKGFGRVGRVKS